MRRTANKDPERTPTVAANRLLFDLGNTRLKGGRLDASGRLAATSAVAVDAPADWETWIDDLAGSEPVEAVAAASVHPPLAERLAALLERRGLGPVRWFRSAADVPVRHWLESPERTGADRALAVLQALRSRSGKPAGAGLVVQCGTAITVEAIDARGVWRGGAIGIGPGLAARALGVGTAQLPELDAARWRSPVESYGPSTETALAAGIRWGTIGAVRELIQRAINRINNFDEPPYHHQPSTISHQPSTISHQPSTISHQPSAINHQPSAISHQPSAISHQPSTISHQPSAPWILWTGGDADWIAAEIVGAGAVIEPHLVLRGLAAAIGDADAGGSP